MEIINPASWKQRFKLPRRVLINVPDCHPRVVKHYHAMHEREAEDLNDLYEFNLSLN
jgi:hypothetical protein